jgi:hypothetical protein
MMAGAHRGARIARRFARLQRTRLSIEILRLKAGPNGFPGLLPVPMSVDHGTPAPSPLGPLDPLGPMIAQWLFVQCPQRNFFGMPCGLLSEALFQTISGNIQIRTSVDRKVSDMTTKHKHDNPILVTGAAGAVGGIGRNLTEFLLARGHKVRALVRREDERAEALRRLGAEVIEGDLTDLASMHRAIEGCWRIYFGMSVSPAYLEATINTAAVARHHGVDAFVNMSQMTVTQMSITETTDSPQHKLHWLAEQALSWSGLPVVTVRPTV